MGKKHKVQPGDCLSSIAAYFRLKSYRTIYDHPQNADFKKKRPNPNVIYPGDVVYIPDHTPKEESCQTDMLHRFSVLRPLVKLRIRLLDQDRRPYKSKKYKITVDTSEETWSGDTTDGGLVEAEIPASATSGKLQIWLTDDSDGQASMEMPLDIGHLDPIDEVKGVQARLNHLGFDCGGVDGIVGPKTRSAVARFQKRYELKDTGEIDGRTRDKLHELHDKE